MPFSTLYSIVFGMLRCGKAWEHLKASSWTKLENAGKCNFLWKQLHIQRQQWRICSKILNKHLSPAGHKFCSISHYMRVQPIQATLQVKIWIIMPPWMAEPMSRDLNTGLKWESFFWNFEDMKTGNFQGCCFSCYHFQIYDQKTTSQVFVVRKIATAL